MTDNGERASLHNLLGGEIVERFDAEMEKLLKNILDPTTDAEDRREITMTVTFAPNETRDVIKVVPKFKVKASLPKPEPTTLFVGLMRNGEIVATEHNPKQQKLFSDEAQTPPKLVKGEEG